MNIAPVSLSLISKTTALPAFGVKSKTHKKENSIQKDIFVKNDGYTKQYKALVLKSNRAEREAAENETEFDKLNSNDIKFLLDIRDYDKFKAVISTPVEEEKWDGTDKLNIFFFTNADATGQLAKRLNKNGDRVLLKKLLMQQRGYGGKTVFHDIAKQDDIKKAHALKNNLSVKEFKKFMKAKDDYGITPYSIAQDEDNRVKALVEPLFAYDFPEY